jgi:hypothetical protein
MLMQVLQLTPDQINALDPEQQASVRQLVSCGVEQQLTSARPVPWRRSIGATAPVAYIESVVVHRARVV